MRQARTSHSPQFGTAYPAQGYDTLLVPGEELGKPPIVWLRRFATGHSDKDILGALDVLRELNEEDDKPLPATFEDVSTGFVPTLWRSGSQLETALRSP